MRCTAPVFVGLPDYWRLLKETNHWAIVTLWVDMMLRWESQECHRRAAVRKASQRKLKMRRH